MILTCPRCATRYLIEADQVWTAGRSVRCEACGQQWRAYGEGAPPSQAAGEIASPDVTPPEAPPSAVAPEAEPTPAPALFRTPPVRRAKPRHGTPGLAWIMATMIVLAVGAVALVAFRDQIVRADPELADVYARLGLTVSRAAPVARHG